MSKHLCPVCKEPFKYLSNLSKHIENDHQKPPEASHMHHIEDSDGCAECEAEAAKNKSKPASPVPPRVWRYPNAINSHYFTEKKEYYGNGQEYLSKIESDALLAEAVKVARELEIAANHNTDLLIEIREFLLGLCVRCDIMDDEFYLKIIDRSHTRMIRGKSKSILEKLPVGESCARSAEGAK